MNRLISTFAVFYLVGVISTDGRDPLCPYPSLVLTFFPDPYDCAKFYECYNGEKSVVPCPGGLYWNQEEKVCDYKENVQCEPQPEPNPPPTTAPTGSTTTGAPSVPSSSGPSTIPPKTTTFTPDPNCPYPSEIITYDYVPGNCTAFYECDHGKRYRFDCQNGLEWNHIHNYCDYPENVDCSRSPVTTVITSSTTSDPRCAGVADGTLIADIHDCSKFYSCVGGHAISEVCPPGTEWHDEIKTCDFPQNANCTPK